MRKVITVVVVGMMMLANQAYAANGDFIVDGKLGIGTGTATPSEFIEIKGDSSGKGLAIYTPLAGNGAGTNVSWYSDTTGSTKQTIGLFSVVNDGNNVRKGRAYLQLANGGTPGIVTTWTSDGNVGIGTMSPLLKFVVSNSGANGFEVNPVSGANAGTDILSYNRAGSAYTTMSLFGSDIRFNVNGNNEKMRIDANGNVGIGKNPQHKLDVAGDVYANDVKLTSDARFKKNLLPIDSPINKVMSLNGLSYEWKTDEFKDKGFAEGRHYGVIAQEIEKVLPEVVNTGADGTKAVAYTEIIPVLIEAIKEQQKLISEQQKRIEMLEKKL